MRVPTLIRLLAPPVAVFLAAVTLAGRASPGLVCAQSAARPVVQQSSPPTSPEAPPRTGEKPAKGLSEGEKAILAVDEAFVQGYNKGDSKALGTMFAEDAEVVESGGGRHQGRDRIVQRLADIFTSSPGARIAIETDSIRFLTPEVAKEEGRSLVTPTEGTPEESAFTVLYVKRDGRWLICSVREEPVEAASPRDRLKDLEWMVGEWVEERDDSVVRFSCRWAEGGNFLLRDAVAKREGKPVILISQHIGWDPLERQVRSWEFDSAGGFGGGRWSRAGDRWTIKHAGVQADGLASSATNIMTREGRDLVRWASTDRVVGGESIPDGEGAVLVRVAPPPRPQSLGPAKDSGTPSTPRDQR